MKDYRRLNVAVTRARRQCTLIGDSETLNSDALLQRLVAYFSEQGEHWSAQEFLPDVRFYSAPPPKKNSGNNKKKKNKKKPAAKSQSESKPSANNSTSSTATKNTTADTAPNTNQSVAPIIQSPDVTRVISPAPEVTPVNEEETSDTEETTNPTNETSGSNNNNTTNTAAKKKKKKKKPAAKPNTAANTAAKKDKLTNEKESFENMTDDEVLEHSLKYKNVCHYPQCDKSVAIVGSVCDHCHFKYCYVSAARVCALTL